MNKYDHAFRVMNPYFKIYGHELAKLTSEEVDITKRVQLSQSKNLLNNKPKAG